MRSNFLPLDTRTQNLPLSVDKKSMNANRIAVSDKPSRIGCTVTQEMVSRSVLQNGRCWEDENSFTIL
jgi:hypothetical protein